MRKIFFFHAPKAGGTSIRHALSIRFAADEIAPIIENDVAEHRAHAGEYRQYRGYSLYQGHYGPKVFRAVDDNHLKFTNFRHPVTRIYSLYRYFRSIDVAESLLELPHFGAVRAARTMSLADFATCDDEIVLTYTSNQQTRQLTGSPLAYHRSPDVSAAICAVDGMDWFYVCEEPALSLAWLREVIGDIDVPTVNVTAAPAIADELSANADAIASRNEGDLAVYDYAVRKLRGRRVADRIAA